jgi:radical SAM protein with 4Fe4S-binding SPASM domain
MNAATQENLRRKSAYVDSVQMHNRLPLPSWIDINLTELCNRACVFCPRVDPDFYPNQPVCMTIYLAHKIANQLRDIGYKGVVVFCGYGEPMLHPDLLSIVSCFHGLRVELVTNGDHLTPNKITSLMAAGVAYFVVSLYDGPVQMESMKVMFELAGCSDAHYLLRDRWHTEADAFGLKLTNRAGTIQVGKQDEVNTEKPCHYLAYQMTIDWNGDVLLCPQDWHKRVKFGNLASQSLVDVWQSPSMHKKRMRLIDGKRCEAPCKGCNTDGTLHGFNHVPVWKSHL